jgi:hypothetical protein
MNISWLYYPFINMSWKQSEIHISFSFERNESGTYSLVTVPRPSNAMPLVLDLGIGNDTPTQNKAESVAKERKYEESAIVAEVLSSCAAA